MLPHIKQFRCVGLADDDRAVGLHSFDKEVRAKSDTVDEDAERRLKVLEHHTELGAGYRVALKDMELRGAGNLLGPEQSGFVTAVGFDLYLRMLDETVRRVMRGDNAPPHTMENSFRKAYSARTFRVPSGELVKRVKDNPTAPFVYLSNVVAAQGALPIKIGDDVIGAVGVSGAPGGEKDEVCAKAGIDKAADTLK